MHNDRRCVAVIGFWVACWPSLAAQTILVEFSDGGGYVFSDQEGDVPVAVEI